MGGGSGHWHLSSEHFLYKIDFFDVFMHFELRWYADGASNLSIEVWDSSASELQQCLDMHNFLRLGSHNRKKHLSLSNSTTVSDLSVKP